MFLNLSKKCIGLYKMKVAVIDLGSNSFHMVIYRIDKDMSFRSRGHYSDVNALGRYISETAELPLEKIRESVKSVSHLARKARGAGVDRDDAYGTGFFRKIGNSMTLVDEIFKSTGIVVEVLDEKAEAEIIFRAACHAYGLKEPSLVIDIGGGSSEFIMAEKGRQKWFQSLPFGTASLYQQIKEKRISGEKRYITDCYAEVICRLQKRAPARCYGTAGFLRYLATWLNKSSELEQGILFSRRDIVQAYVRLETGKLQKGTSRERALVRVGLLILKTVMQKVKVPSITVSTISSREGYLLAKMDRQ